MDQRRYALRLAQRETAARLAQRETAARLARREWVARLAPVLEGGGGGWCEKGGASGLVRVGGEDR